MLYQQCINLLCKPCYTSSCCIPLTQQWGLWCLHIDCWGLESPNFCSKSSDCGAALYPLAWLGSVASSVCKVSGMCWRTLWCLQGAKTLSFAACKAQEAQEALDCAQEQYAMHPNYEVSLHHVWKLSNVCHATYLHILQQWNRSLELDQAQAVNHLGGLVFCKLDGLDYFFLLFRASNH